jgi:hypothetical protein
MTCTDCGATIVGIMTECRDCEQPLCDGCAGNDRRCSECAGERADERANDADSDDDDED